MKLDIEVTISKNDFEAIAADIRSRLNVVLRKVALDLERRAKDNADQMIYNGNNRNPLPTGALKASIFTVTNKFSTYEQAVAEAKSLNPSAQMIARPVVDAELTAFVAVGVLYGLYVNFGTVNVPARPFFTQAV